MAEPSATATGAKVRVTPEQFHLITYDAGEIAAIASEMAERLGVANPFHVIVDETTPLGKMSVEVGDAAGTGSSDATITARFESGALENGKRLTTFGPDQAREAIGRMLLRARDRLSPDFGEPPSDFDLTLAQNAAWDTYCVGRLERAGLRVNQQRWRYNHRNRFGFTDEVDADFDRIWAADALTWSDLDPAG